MIRVIRDTKYGSKYFFQLFQAFVFEKPYYFLAFPAYFLKKAIFPASPAFQTFPASVDILTQRQKYLLRNKKTKSNITRIWL